MNKELEDIKKGKISPVYVLSGEEVYQIEEVKRALDVALLQKEEDEMNRCVFDMNEASLSEILSEASSFPFFGEKRLIFAENATFLTGKKGGTVSDVAKEELLAYIKNPLETTVLVFILNGNLDTRTKLGKAIKKAGVVVETTPPKDFEVKQLVAASIKQRGLEITEKNLVYFLYLTGHHLANSMVEVEKFQVYLGDKREITKEIIDELVPKSMEQNIFDLSDFLLQGKTEATITLFSDLLLQGNEVIAMNALILSRIRLILQCQILMKLGYHQSNIVSTLKANPYAVKFAMTQANIYPKKYLFELFDKLVEQDFRLKTGFMNPKLLFEFFVLEMAGGKK